MVDKMKGRKKIKEMGIRGERRERKMIKERRKE